LNNPIPINEWFVKSIIYCLQFIIALQDTNHDQYIDETFITRRANDATCRPLHDPYIYAADIPEVISHWSVERNPADTLQLVRRPTNQKPVNSGRPAATRQQIPWPTRFNEISGRLIRGINLRQPARWNSPSTVAPS